MLMSVAFLGFRALRTTASGNNVSPKPLRKDLDHGTRHEDHNEINPERRYP